MIGKKASKKNRSFLSRHKILKYLLYGLLILALLTIGLILLIEISSAIRQRRLQPFYDTKGLLTQGKLGEIVRQEPLGIKVANGTGYRVLYRTQRGDGSYTFSSGMIFVPNNNNAGLPRPVVAWAHGTLGLGEECAPSRTANPLSGTEWITSMLQKGWVVTTTDYAGLGTPGTSAYLVGADEAHDVLNSVRAARNFVAAQAGTNYVIWGHSQGGNSALFSASLAGDYAPELHLEATVASAPAAELVPLLSEQYGTVADWVIGPLIQTSWPASNPTLNSSNILTATGRNNYQRIANHCILQSTIAGLVRNILGQKFFSTNPLDVPDWKAMAEKQSAPTLTPSQPLMVVESKTDQVVLPNTTALYIQKACQANGNVTTYWLNNVSHPQIPTQSAPTVIGWLADRFANKSSTPSCDQKLPVTPAIPQ